MSKLIMFLNMDGLIHFSTTAEFALRIVIAGICGFIIGLERGYHQKAAGVRTHVIVSCASALLMLISKYGFLDMPFFDGASDADPARIAAQVVTGISFLGAGVIFKDGNAIKGLTTAAGIWSTAAIGLSIGAGMYLIGIFVTAMLTIYMLVMHKFPIGRDALMDYRLLVTVSTRDDYYPVIKDRAAMWNAEVNSFNCRRESDGSTTYTLNLKASTPIKDEDVSAFMNSDENIVFIGSEEV
ncbi:MAG: MgtC/SapB family protein [Eubacterium sp.]|nr:MgtC/SapB family protein [Eubacterium sp.]